VSLFRTDPALQVEHEAQPVVLQNSPCAELHAVHVSEFGEDEKNPMSHSSQPPTAVADCLVPGGQAL
jgi:hypothetical protein